MIISRFYVWYLRETAKHRGKAAQTDHVWSFVHPKVCHGGVYLIRGNLINPQIGRLPLSGLANREVSLFWSHKGCHVWLCDYKEFQPFFFLPVHCSLLIKPELLEHVTLLLTATDPMYMWRALAILTWNSYNFWFFREASDIQSEGTEAKQEPTTSAGMFDLTQR